MPELPEVESVVRALRSRLRGRSILDVEECFAGVYATAGTAGVRWPARIEDVRRRAKLILVDVEGGAVLVAHLRMTGHLSVVDRSTPVRPHTHVRIRLNGPDEIRFVDPRRFGRIRLESGTSLARWPFYAGLGPEPLEVGVEGLAAGLGSTRAAIKAAMLDQRRLAGIGNIYADEILFDCGLHPRQPADTVLNREWAPLLASIQRILGSAIERGGSTIRDYRSVDGAEGSFQDSHRVFGRQGERCGDCHTPIRKIRVAGRGTHFCPGCQPLRRRRRRRHLRGPSSR